MFNLTSSAPKSWQTVSRQADRANAEQTRHTYHAEPVPTIQELGVILRERREALGASLAEVEAATKIRQKYLAALESDDWHLLPGEIVGRGFLRNYATYLGLDQTELIERRRAVADPSMNSTLAGTSAASPLPPERNVDYRPKDVALKDEPEGIQQREIRTGPILTVLGLFGVLFVAWWLMSTFGGQFSNGLASSINGVQTRVAADPLPVTTTMPGSEAAIENLVAPDSSAADSNVPAVTENSNSGSINTGAASATDNSAAESSVDGTTNGTEGQSTNAPETSQPVVVPPTATPTAAAPRRLLIPTNTPVPNFDVSGSGNTSDSTLDDTSLSDDASSTNDTVAVTSPAQNEAVTSAELEPTPTQPAPTPVPPTNTPLPEPTATFTPAPPLVVAPACPDPRAAISAPGVNQVLTGAATVTGSATHEAFQYYKLEYAFGAGATEGFVYFDGAESPVQGGVLGTFNTPSLPNGEYTLQLTVVDLSANYPPPCRVSVTIVN